MKYIFSDDNGIHLERYFEYINSLKDVLPTHIFEFASNLNNYSLESHSSLHDAWLDYAKITESATGERSEKRTVDIEVRFLGPFHDRRIYLFYVGVVGYEFKAGNLESGHGDVWIHELQVNENSQLIHELVFFDNRSIKVTCRDFTHREELLADHR